MARWANRYVLAAWLGLAFAAAPSWAGPVGKPTRAMRAVRPIAPSKQPVSRLRVQGKRAPRTTGVRRRRRGAQDPLRPNREGFSIRARLRHRGVDTRTTRVFVSDRHGTATFPIFNLLGQWIGFQRYNPRGQKKAPGNSLNKRYYTYLTEGHKRMGIWGLESLAMNGGEGPVFVVEGIFDAIRIQNAGYAALATLTSSPTPDIKNQIGLLGRRIIVIRDRDQGGDRMEDIPGEVHLPPEGHKDMSSVAPRYVRPFLRGLIER